MYSTIIRQQHIIDRTEQERLLLSFIAQKYYKTKGSIQRGAMRVLCAERCSWNTESQHAGCAALRVRIEKKSTEGRDIDAKCIKSALVYWAFSFNSFKPQWLCALEEFDCSNRTERNGWQTDRRSGEKSLCELEFNDLNIHLYLRLNYGTASEHLNYNARTLYGALWCLCGFRGA